MGQALCEGLAHLGSFLPQVCANLVNTLRMASHPASPVPGAHSSLKLAALPALPVEGASPPNTLEPLPFRTVKPEVRTWQLAFSPSGIFLLRTLESSTAPIKPSPWRPVRSSVAESPPRVTHSGSMGREQRNCPDTGLPALLQWPLRMGLTAGRPGRSTQV